MLAMVLPAVLILLGWFGYMRPGKTLREVTAALSTAQASDPKPPDFAAAQNMLAKSRTDADEVKKQHEQWSERWTTIKHERSAASSERVVGVENVTWLLRRAGLRVKREVPSDQGGGRLPPELSAAIKRLAEKDQALQPKLWQIEFVGKYADVVKALGFLPEACPLAIPVRLDMRGSTGSALRSWTLVLWI
jgi:hypothetical protein